MRVFGSTPLASDDEAFVISNDDADGILENVSWGRFNDALTASPSGKSRVSASSTSATEYVSDCYINDFDTDYYRLAVINGGRSPTFLRTERPSAISANSRKQICQPHSESFSSRMARVSLSYTQLVVETENR